MRKYSHSALKVFQRCQKKWSYLYIDRIVPKQKSKALLEGIERHDLLAEYYTTGFMFFDGDIPDWLDRYDKMYDGDEDWDIISVEQDFEFTVGKHTVVFKPDLVVEINGEVWIVDHKTTANIPDEWDPYNMSDFQHLLYIAGVEQALGREVQGFMFNYIRTKPPTQPRLLKSGNGIADVRRVDTDYDTLYAFAEENGMLNHPDVVDRLMIIKGSPNKFFQRHFLPINRSAVERAVEDTKLVLDEMRWAEAHDRYPRHVLSGFGGASACGRCEYQPLCHAELLGINAEPLLLDYEEKPRKEEQDEGTA